MALPTIAYKVSHRNIKFPLLEFKTGELLLVLPFGYEAMLFWRNMEVGYLKGLDL
jgi:hypothetical protein